MSRVHYFSLYEIKQKHYRIVYCCCWYWYLLSSVFFFKVYRVYLIRILLEYQIAHVNWSATSIIRHSCIVWHIRAIWSMVGFYYFRALSFICSQNSFVIAHFAHDSTWMLLSWVVWLWLRHIILKNKTDKRTRKKIFEIFFEKNKISSCTERGQTLNLTWRMIQLRSFVIVSHSFYQFNQ